MEQTTNLAQGEVIDQPRWWVSRIKDDKGSSGLERSQHGPDQCGTAMSIDGNNISRCDAGRTQIVGKTVADVVQAPVGNGFSYIYDSELIRYALGLLRKEVVDAPFPAVGKGGSWIGQYQLGRRSYQRAVRDFFLNSKDLRCQRDILAQHFNRSLLVKQISIVKQFKLDAIGSFKDVKRQ